ncbi:hypothetical protein Ahy_A08g038221 [Arachis hypogaea]|uniref:Uncharacterized protein n=1 Tax=Arachis hypogaea TaxID=3818 RepID=A0A445BSW3_ARAHY|nr:hypothetical protein Ahy_A08g038221 [Arachis hypogaea]
MKVFSSIGLVNKVENNVEEGVHRHMVGVVDNHKNNHHNHWISIHHGLVQIHSMPEDVVAMKIGVLCFCVRQKAANFMFRFMSAEGKPYLINTAYSPSKVRYEWYVDSLRGLSQEMADWAGRFNKEIWLQHCDGGRRFGHMTTNLSECIHIVLKGTRCLLISSIIRCTLVRLQKLFVTKGREAQAQLTAENYFSQRLMAAVEKNRESIPKMHVTHYDRQASVFVVEELEPFEGWSQEEEESHDGGTNAWSGGYSIDDDDDDDDDRGRKAN